MTAQSVVSIRHQLHRLHQLLPILVVVMSQSPMMILTQWSPRFVTRYLNSSVPTWMSVTARKLTLRRASTTTLEPN